MTRSSSLLMGAVILGVLAIGSPARAERDPTREALVMIPLENASLPDGMNGGPISSEFIHSARLHGLLRRLGAVSIDRAVPRFDKKKIWMTSRTGRRVKLPDWSRLFRISFPTETSR